MDYELDEILGKNVISWKEYEWLTENFEDVEILSRLFICPECEGEYTIAVRHFWDGEQPDSKNTRIYVIK